MREIRKQVGDGSTIKVWHDRWIPDSRDGKVKSNRTTQEVIQYVRDLICQGQWNKELLSRIFCKEEAQKVANIQLSIHQKRDRLFRNFSKTRGYTVKYSYALAKEMATMASKSVQIKEQTSSHNNKENLWKKV